MVDAPPPPAPAAATAPAGGRWAPALIVGLFRLLQRTWRVRRHGFALLEDALARGPVVLAFWHGQQTIVIGSHLGGRFAGMSSHSRDGELLAQCIKGLGYRSIRGSSSRGGKEAFDASLQALAEGWSPSLAVDGPRGPRHEPHVGAVALAARSGRPVVWIVSRLSPCWRLSSWDRFEIPLPFCRADLVYGLLPPLPDPEDRQAVEAARQQLGEQMRAAMSALQGGGDFSARGSTPS